MRKFLDYLFRIPRLMLRLIWSLVLGVFKTILFLALVAALLFTYAQTSNSSFAQSINQVFSKVTFFVNSRATKDTIDAVSQLATDTHENATSARWSNRQATVYLKSTDETLRLAYQKAIAQWNAAGVFTFVLVDQESTADIIATDMSDANTKAAGLADTQTNSLTNYLVHADVYLNSYFLLNEDYGYSFERIVNTASHELGHAIGLAHNDSQDSVMQSAGSYFSIQASDIEAVNTLYA